MFCFSSGQPIYLGPFVFSTIIGDNEIIQGRGSVTLSMDAMAMYGMCKLVPKNMLCENFIASVSIQFNAKEHSSDKILVHLIRIRNKGIEGKIELPPKDIFSPEILATIEFTFDDSLATFYDEAVAYRNSWKITKTISVRSLLSAGDLIGVTTSHYNVDLSGFCVNATAC